MSREDLTALMAQILASAAISQQLDQFLVEFLRVNEEACAKR